MQNLPLTPHSLRAVKRWRQLLLMMAYMRRERLRLIIILYIRVWNLLHLRWAMTELLLKDITNPTKATETQWNLEQD